MQINDMGKWTINTISITGTDAYAPTYSMGSQELAVVIPDETSVEAAKQAIHDTMYPAYTKEKRINPKQNNEMSNSVMILSNGCAFLEIITFL